MPTEPWDDPDLDHFEFLQGRMETAGDWADSEQRWLNASSHDDFVADRGSRRPQLLRSLPELSQPNSDVKRFRILETFKGEEYELSEHGWSLHRQPFTFVPIVGRLDNQLRTRLTAEDAGVEDPADLVVRAWFGQALGHSDRVAELSARAMRAVIHPPNPMNGGAIVASAWVKEALGAAAMLSSALRDLNESQRALDETEAFASEGYAPLMTSRAAALCDVGRWEEGRVLAQEAHGLEDSAEVRRLLDRIASHFASRPLHQAH